ncbi:MAG: DUF192 domain-containing protein [Candidatus Pacearchaeota archaeon]|nr:DUF192 domain-containing protein [Candidatus Pacearchaeota archaeon]
MEEKTIIIFVILSILVFVLVSGCQKSNEVCFNNSCFDVELALTPEARSLGLMFRDNLKDNEGMLFVFPEEKIHGFWMKNTFVPLDIIWINSQGKVVFISSNTQPCKGEPCPSIIPTSPAKYVLEIKAGRAKQIGFDVDDILTINVPKEIIESAK